MLRASILAARPAARPLARAARPQWRVAQRWYADDKKLDQTAVPNPAPLVEPTFDPASSPTVAQGTIPPSEVPRAPPAPATTIVNDAAAASAASASRVAPAVQPATTPPTGPGTASVAPDPVKPAPKPKKRRFRRFLLWLTILSGLSYAGGVYYSLVSDNFHDFFTEYVPFGEDAVAYFEEREFKRRFPARADQPRLHQQISGEKKVTIPGKSGLTSRVAEDPHTSAVSDNNPKAKPAEQPRVGSNEHTPNKDKSVQEAKKVEQQKERPAAATSATTAEPKTVIVGGAPATPISQIDHLSVPSASEPVVQDVVKIVNDLITVVNADKSHDGKYNSALDKAKSDLAKVVSDISLLKGSLKKEAEDKVKAAHAEFDEAAKELVQRLDHQMQEQETHWKEEYENERERLQQAYRSKVKSELDAAHKVYEAKLKNELLEQSIHLQKSFTQNVRDRVEAERDGRLGKLTDLSNSVHELEKLTAEWNQVVDANLKTQHLVVAVEAVKSALETQVVPKPFVTELAALKEIAADDPVVSAAISSINPTAYQRGIPSSALLIDRFRRVASEVRKAALLPEDAGVASHLASLAMSKVLFKKSGLAVGGDVEAVLARTEVLLEEGDLDAAAREMNGLQGWAKVLSKDWLGECRRVLEVRQALDVIATEARLQSLLVD
jgi:mitofilin